MMNKFSKKICFSLLLCFIFSNLGFCQETDETFDTFVSLTKSAVEWKDLITLENPESDGFSLSIYNDLPSDIIDIKIPSAGNKVSSSCWGDCCLYGVFAVSLPRGIPKQSTEMITFTQSGTHNLDYPDCEHMVILLQITLEDATILEIHASKFTGAVCGTYGCWDYSLTSQTDNYKVSYPTTLVNKSGFSCANGYCLDEFSYQTPMKLAKFRLYKNVI